jgi:hypothetical protein
MLTPGNTKLGEGIWGFSLPALITCPGKTAACEDFCYALQGHFLLPSVQAFYLENYKATLAADFTERIRAELIAHMIKLLRVHVSGDYYSLPYLRKWLAIARAGRRTHFFGYTRSWRVPKLRPALTELAALPNFSLWWSVDRATPEPPQGLGGAGLAYMSTGDDDLPGYPVGLVFRDSERTAMKFTPNGDFVCPYEQGVKRRPKITCSRCRYCLWPRELRRPAAAPDLGGRLALALV